MTSSTPSWYRCRAVVITCGRSGRRTPRSTVRLRHEKEIAAHQSFNYALFDAAETALLGCVYIDPPERAGADGEISWSAWLALPEHPDA